MGLPVILSALHLFPLVRRRRERDPERADSEKSRRREEEESDSGTPSQETGDDAVDNDDEELYDPLTDPDPSRRLHRLSSATNDTFFASTVDRKSTFNTDDSLNAHKAWYTKVKDYIFPPEESESALEKFVPNYRWTPIISGVVVPFALLLEIPGLTEHWYIRTEGNTVVESKPNSAILDTGLAISMACGLFANICLVLRFLETRVKTVTIMTMAFLTIHGAFTFNPLS